MKKAFYIWLSVITVLLSSTIFKTNVFAAPQVSINEPKVPLVNNASDFDMLFTVGLTEGEFSQNSVTYKIMVNNKEYDSGNANKLLKANQEFIYAVPLSSSELKANDAVTIVLTARYRTSVVTKAVQFTILDKDKYNELEITGNRSIKHDFSKNGPLEYQFDVNIINSNGKKEAIADATVEYGSNRNTAIEKFAKYTATLTSDMIGEIEFSMTNTNIPSNTHSLTLENIKEKIPVNFKFAFDKLFVPLGERQKIHFDLSPKEYLETSIIWSSSDSKTIAVSDGYLIGVAPGKATITATVDGKDYSVVAECYSSITKIIIEGDKEDELVLEMGEERKIQYELFPYEAEPQGTVKFISSNLFVFAVSADGTITGKNSGEAELTLEVDGVIEKRKVRVIDNIKSVQLRPNEIHLLVDRVASIKPDVFPESSAKYCNGAWASSNPEVAGMENGKVVARSPGEATITYRCRYKKAEAKVYVTRYQSDFELKEKQIEIFNGNKFDLNEILIPLGEDNDIAFEVKDSVYGRIENGIFEALKVGQVDIEVFTKNQREEITIRILALAEDEKEKYCFLNNEYVMESSLDNVRHVKFYNDAFNENNQGLELVYQDLLFTENGKVIYDFSEVNTEKAKDLTLVIKNRRIRMSDYIGKKLELEFDYEKGNEYYKNINVQFGDNFFAPLSIPFKINSSDISINEIKYIVSEAAGTQVYWITNEGKILERGVVLDEGVIVEKEQEEITGIFKAISNRDIYTEEEIRQQDNSGILKPIIGIFGVIFVIACSGIIFIIKKL